MDPMDKEGPLNERLEALGIAFETVRHPPVLTVAEAKSVREGGQGGHVKNLLLRDKKRTLWLLTAHEDAQVDLKALRSVLGAKGTLSFASADLMRESIGVDPGAVTPFAVINDTVGRVTMVLDRKVLDQDLVHAHPLHNEATTALSSKDLLRFLESCEHAPRVVDI